MSDCVLESPAGAEYRQKMISIARNNGLKLRPHELQYCEFHRNTHVVHIYEADVVDSRYGLSPVEVEAKSEPDTYVKRSYCQICCAYHNGSERCAGERSPGSDWGKKEI